MISRTANIYPESSELTIVEDGNQLKLEYAANGKGYELQTPEKIAVDTAYIYKPIQYLGAKHRPLPIILSKTLEAIKPDTFVLDMFSGSSVVSQVFNLNGLNVISNDALHFNSAFAKTLLNIDREETDLKIIPLVMEELKSYKLKDEFAKPFEEKIKEEKKLLAERNTEKLLELYFGLPQPSDDILTDIKVTSIKQPQSSCPFKDAKQKVFGLGYNLLVFVYDKTDDPKSKTATLNFVSCSFVAKERTADYTTTYRLREMVKDKANEADIIAYSTEE